MSWIRRAGNGLWNLVVGQGGWGSRNPGIGTWTSAQQSLIWSNATLTWTDMGDQTWLDLYV